MAANGAFDAVACCGAIVIAAEPVTIPLLRRLHAVDTPSGRSSHSVPTPRGGGLPIAVGLLAAVAMTRGGAAAAFAAAVGFFGVLGFVDDLRRLPAPRRLALQATGSAVVAGLLVLPVHPAVAGVLLAVAAAVWITGFVNAFNFMDGVNGISGAHALIAGVAYACYAESGQHPIPVMSPVSSGCLKESPTKLIAPRLYTSSGCATSSTPIRLERSRKSPSRS